MSQCATAASQGLVHGLLDSVDCNIRVLVHDSYRDLLGPGTVFAAALTGMLTIYVALIGYQMLLGRGGLALSRLPLIGLKLGLIMALLTSWAAYQGVVFNLLFEGPRDLIAAMTTPLRHAYPHFDADLYSGVENVYAALAHAGAVYGGQASEHANILQGGPMLGAGLLWLCGAGVLLSTIGLILACKIVLGFLLAVGPVFVGFLLFDSTRGLFDGWLRVTLGVALAPLAANVFGVVMLLMLQPFVAALSENAEANTFDMGPIMTISLIVTVFAGILSATLRLTGGIAAGFGSAREPRDFAQMPTATSATFAERRSSETSSMEFAPAAPEAPRPAEDAAYAAARMVTAAAAENVVIDIRPVSDRLGQRGRQAAQAATRRGGAA